MSPFFQLEHLLKIVDLVAARDLPQAGHPGFAVMFFVVIRGPSPPIVIIKLRPLTPLSRFSVDITLLFL